MSVCLFVCMVLKATFSHFSAISLRPVFTGRENRTTPRKLPTFYSCLEKKDLSASHGTIGYGNMQNIRISASYFVKKTATEIFVTHGQTNGRTMVKQYTPLIFEAGI